MRFEDAGWLLLALPWVVFFRAFRRRQRRACEWLWEQVGERFRGRLTSYTRGNFRWRMRLLFILGLLLVLALGRPTLRDPEARRELSGRVVLVLDASASMRASDVDWPQPKEGEETRQDRFEQARRIASELCRQLDGYRFGLVTFSGVATLELPMTARIEDLDEALRVVEIHNFYRSSGSSFRSALDRILPFTRSDPERRDLQAVLLSDGEMPVDEAYDDALAALAAEGVVVHTVALGSEEGQPRVIYDLRDVVAGKEEKTVLREYTTRREDRHLRRIARTTGGSFHYGGRDAAPDLAAEITRAQRTVGEGAGEGRRDAGPLLLALALAGMLLEGFAARRPPGDPNAFDLRRLGGPRGSPGSRPTAGPRAGLAVLLAASILAVACPAGGPEEQAGRENEAGIAADALRAWETARTHYERSLSHQLHAEIPTFNLARSVTLQEDYTQAHDLYQRALELAPDLAPAHYNDGWVLFAWGEAERDPLGCQLQHTRELWEASKKRFAAAVELSSPAAPAAEAARLNLRFVSARLEEIERLLAEPPAECPEGSSGGSGGGARTSNGDGEEGDDGEASSAADSSGSPPPSGGREDTGRADPRGAAGGSTLTGEERDQIVQALERLSEQGRGEEKFHRRTRASQLPGESWRNPDPEIWW